MHDGEVPEKSRSAKNKIRDFQVAVTISATLMIANRQ